MRKVVITLIMTLLTVAGIAQNTRVVNGIVQTSDGKPIVGATIKAVDEDVTTTSTVGGAFEVRVSPYCKFVEASIEGYTNGRAEIDGSYIIFRLKFDKKYAEEKAKAEAERKAAEEQARIEAEKARIAAEKEAAAKAEAERRAQEQARIEAEKARIAAEKEAAAKAEAERKAQEQARIEAEKARIAAEKEAAAKAEAERRAQEQARIEAEKARIAAQKQAEAERIAAQKQAEAERIAKEKAEIAAVKKEKRDALRIEYAKPIKGYESFVNISYFMTNNDSYVGVDYIGGYRFNNIFFLGAGVGADMRLTTPISQIEMNEALELSHGAFYFPVYAHFRAQLLNRRCAPFLALSAGYNISLPQSFDIELTKIKYNASGVFVNPQFGVAYRVKPKLGIYCAVGFNACMMPECIGNTGYSATIKQSFKYGINVNLGISF